METTDRRYDIDWLRVIAIGLLLIYHIAIGFQPWGVFIKFIQNNNSLEYLWIPMTMLNIWRIPLLFFVSGMGVCFAMRKRTWKQLILERTRRILIPLIFGALTIVPLYILLWLKYYNQDLAYAAKTGHLWFLANIFIYVILLSPLFFYLKKKEKGAFVRGLKKLFANPLGLLTISIPFIIEAILINPETFELYATTLHGFLLGLLAFFFGFTFILSGEIFWRTVLKWRWLYLSLAIILYTIRLIVFELKAPHYLMAIESTSWILAVLAFANKYLNRPGKTLSYLSQAAYPVYILHMLFLYLASYILFPLDIPVVLKLILVVFFTFISSFSVYELIIRKVNYIRPLFGLKYKASF